MSRTRRDGDPRTGAARRAFRCAAVCAAAALCALFALFGTFSPVGKAASAAGASSAIVVEVSTGRVLSESNADAKAYPASTTKILTALVVLETLPLDLVVTVPREAAGVEGSSVYLRAGEKLTVEELLYGLMLRSGNDAAVALALAAGGSVSRFAAMMNERAEKCGAKHSHFVNPHGLHDDEHYTTARDLALITAEAYGNRDFCRIVSTRSVTVGEGESRRYFANKNKLLGTYGGANGVKTGFTTKSGRCLVGGAYRDGMQLVSVVLNRYDMWEATRAMLDKAFGEYEMRDVLSLPAAENGGRAVEVRFDESGAPVPAKYPVKRSGESVGTVFV